MKDADQANGPTKRCVRWRAVGPLDELPDLLSALFTLDLDFEGNFLEALVLVTELVKIFASSIEPAAHLLFQGIDLNIEHARRPTPLGKMAKAKARQKSVSWADPFTKSGAVSVLVGNYLLISNRSFARAVLEPINCHIGCRPKFFWI